MVKSGRVTRGKRVAVNNFKSQCFAPPVPVSLMSVQPNASCDLINTLRERKRADGAFVDARHLRVFDRLSCVALAEGQESAAINDKPVQAEPGGNRGPAQIEAQHKGIVVGKLVAYASVEPSHLNFLNPDSLIFDGSRRALGNSQCVVSRKTLRLVETAYLFSGAARFNIAFVEQYYSAAKLTNQTQVMTYQEDGSTTFL